MKNITRIFNFHQASIFILEGCKVLDCGNIKGSNYILFENDNVFEKCMDKWNKKLYM